MSHAILKTTIVGSLPKPAWLAEPKKLWAPWRLEGEALAEGLRVFDQRMPGFISDEAVLLAPESRTSSPVRIERNGWCESPTVPGLFPAGEGAGFAGGIVSAALDGLRVARYARAKLAGETLPPEKAVTYKGPEY